MEFQPHCVRHLKRTPNILAIYAEAMDINLAPLSKPTDPISTLNPYNPIGLESCAMAWTAFNLYMYQHCLAYETYGYIYSSSKILKQQDNILVAIKETLTNSKPKKRNPINFFHKILQPF